MNTKIIRRAISSSHELSGCEPLLARIYVGRGVNHPNELADGLEELLPYQSLKQIQQAVTMLANALLQQQRVLIIGDFDADGATSSALAVNALRSFGLQQVHFLVPNRFDYGYGLTPEIVDEAAKWQPNLLITVDNGIANFAGVARAKTLGMQVLITDHHLPAEKLPDADAIVNPNQAGDEFPSKHLAGVGVIFYVMAALRAHLRDSGYFTRQQIAMPSMAQFLDLVALGTVADVVTLDKNNRILVKRGIHRIRQGQCRPGILALLTIAGRDYRQLTASDLGFAIAPRLNAAGRLEDMSLGIECLLAENELIAQEKALRLDQLNKERRTIESEMKTEAMQVVSQLQRQNNLPIGLCLYRPEWHQGVVGIVAARVKEKTNRPVIAFAKSSEHELRGSARSVAGLHIRDVLTEMANHEPELLVKFGGHAMAAGLTIHAAKLAKFAELFSATVGRHLSAEDLQGRIYSDGELVANEFSLTTAELLREAGPFGQGFPEPVFDNRFQVITQRLVGERHLKLVLRLPESDLMLDAIVFNVDLAQWPNHQTQWIHAAYRVDVNEYQGNRRMQLIIEHMQII